MMLLKQINFQHFRVLISGHLERCVVSQSELTTKNEATRECRSHLLREYFIATTKLEIINLLYETCPHFADKLLNSCTNPVNVQC